MALALPNRVRFNTATTGTGTMTVGSAVAGYQTPSAVPVGSTVCYGIEDGTAWETGVGTYQSGGLVTRDIVEASSASGSRISLSGSAQAYLTQTGGMLAPLWDSRGRNKFANPLFRVNQRSTGPWTASGYTADQWALVTSLDTVSVSVVALSDVTRAPIGDDEAGVGLQATITGNSNGVASTLICHRVEDLRRLAGKTVVVSFYAFASAAMKVGVSIDQNFGSGGSPSAAVQQNGTSVTIGTTFARYQVALTVPTWVGKTLGTNNNHYTQINLWLSSGTANATRSGNVGVQSGVFMFWGMQAEVGTVATPLEKPEPSLDLGACQRFFQLGQISIQVPGTAGQTLGMSSSPCVQMRAAPTLVLTTNASTNVGTPTLTANQSIFFASAVISATASATLNVSFQASSELQ
jgi:hypothetical protein